MAPFGRYGNRGRTNCYDREGDGLMVFDRGFVKEVFTILAVLVLFAVFMWLFYPAQQDWDYCDAKPHQCEETR